MDKKELKFWVGLSTITAIGPVRFKKIVNYFTSLADFFICDQSQLIKAGIEKWVVAKIIKERDKVDIEKNWQQLEKENIKAVVFPDDDYPKILKEIYDFPPLLYVRGNFKPDDKLAIAVVGTRKLTHYGEQLTEDIVEGLVQAGVIIVSGLARGIDSRAHRVAVNYGGRTIAVLGSGLDWYSIYPRENRKLAEEIVESGGMVISEFPCGMNPHRQNFPMRNRIISGLSLGTLVVEAGERSGALITAKSALDQNREVFAAPGSAYNLSSVGSNNLIKQGAKVVTGANDILEVLDLTLIKESVTMQKISPDSPEEEILLKFLSQEPVQIDQLISGSGLNSEIVNAVLIIMEMKGKVKDVGGKRYVLA